MINVAGENVYPKEVEDILLRHPNLRDVCVVPAPHGVKGEVPVAFVVEREKGRTTRSRSSASAWSTAPPTPIRGGCSSSTRCPSGSPASSTAGALKRRALDEASA